MPVSVGVIEIKLSGSIGEESFFLASDLPRRENPTGDYAATDFIITRHDITLHFWILHDESDKNCVNELKV